MEFEATQVLMNPNESDTDEEIEEGPKKPVAILKVLLQPGYPETDYSIYKGLNVIGRDNTCNVQIRTKALSKKHACIEVQGDQHFIYDHGSTNKTKKNKVNLIPEVRYNIQHGDDIKLADIDCKYSYTQAPKAGQLSETILLDDTYLIDNECEEDRNSDVLLPTQPCSKEPRPEVHTTQLYEYQESVSQEQVKPLQLNLAAETPASQTLTQKQEAKGKQTCGSVPESPEIVLSSHCTEVMDSDQTDSEDDLTYLVNNLTKKVQSQASGCSTQTMSLTSTSTTNQSQRVNSQNIGQPEESSKARPPPTNFSDELTNSDISDEETDDETGKVTGQCDHTPTKRLTFSDSSDDEILVPLGGGDCAAPKVNLSSMATVTFVDDSDDDEMLLSIDLNLTQGDVMTQALDTQCGRSDSNTQVAKFCTADTQVAGDVVISGRRAAAEFDSDSEVPTQTFPIDKDVLCNMETQVLSNIASTDCETQIFVQQANKTVPNRRTVNYISGDANTQLLGADNCETQLFVQGDDAYKNRAKEHVTHGSEQGDDAYKNRAKEHVTHGSEHETQIHTSYQETQIFVRENDSVKNPLACRMSSDLDDMLTQVAGGDIQESQLFVARNYDCDLQSERRDSVFNELPTQVIGCEDQETQIFIRPSDAHCLPRPSVLENETQIADSEMLETQIVVEQSFQDNNSKGRKSIIFPDYVTRSVSPCLPDSAGIRRRFLSPEPLEKKTARDQEGFLIPTSPVLQSKEMHSTPVPSHLRRVVQQSLELMTRHEPDKCDKGATNSSVPRYTDDIATQDYSLESSHNTSLVPDSQPGLDDMDADALPHLPALTRPKNTDDLATQSWDFEQGDGNHFRLRMDSSAEDVLLNSIELQCSLSITPSESSKRRDRRKNQPRKSDVQEDSTIQSTDKKKEQEHKSDVQAIGIEKNTNNEESHGTAEIVVEPERKRDTDRDIGANSEVSMAVVEQQATGRQHGNKKQENASTVGASKKGRDTIKAPSSGEQNNNNETLPKPKGRPRKTSKAVKSEVNHPSEAEGAVGGLPDKYDAGSAELTQLPSAEGTRPKRTRQTASVSTDQTTSARSRPRRLQEDKDQSVEPPVSKDTALEVSVRPKRTCQNAGTTEQQPATSARGRRQRVSPDTSEDQSVGSQVSKDTAPEVSVRPKRTRQNASTTEQQPATSARGRRRRVSPNKSEDQSVGSQDVRGTKLEDQEPTHPKRLKTSANKPTVKAASASIRRPIATVAAAETVPSKRRSVSTEKPRVMFTGLVDQRLQKVVKSLGGTLVDSIYECTHLVTDQIRRTVKLLCAVAKGIHIINLSWLEQCKEERKFVDPAPHILEDPEAQMTYSFNLVTSLNTARKHLMLEGYQIHVTNNVRPSPTQMIDIIQCAGGKFLGSIPKTFKDKVVVVSCEEDLKKCTAAIRLGIPVVTAEFILTGVLHQCAAVDQYKLVVPNTQSKSVNKLTE